jgi:hypothetical protein
VKTKGKQPDFCTSEAQKYEEVPRSTEKYREVPKSTKEVKGSTKKYEEFKEVQKSACSPLVKTLNWLNS